MRKSIFFWASLFSTLLGLGIFVWFCIRGVYYEKFIDSAGDLSLDKSALFGDFIGGCIGAIFALVGVFLLFETLKLQREESKNSSNVFKRQQFDSTFWGQLNLYNEIVSTLSSFDDSSKKGKDFFAFEMNKLQTAFQSNTSLIKRKKEADDNYVSFYIQYKSQIAHYFRVLFRLICFIHESDIDEKDKVVYAKIMRAQLSEGELFFLYYNAFTPYGKNFKSLINRYNLIKHLPKLEKLEFQKYTNPLQGNEKHSVGLVLLDTRRLIDTSQTHIGIDDPKHNLKTYLKGKYTIKIFFPTENMLQVSIIIKNNISYSSYFQQGLGLDRYDENTLICLFRDFLYDIMTYNSFNYCNEITTFTIKPTKQEDLINSKTNLYFEVQRKDNGRLIFDPNYIDFTLPAHQS